MTNAVSTPAIAANIQALAALLKDAAAVAAEAAQAIESGERNQALGTAAPLEQTLAAAAALLGAAIALHRL